MTQDPAADPSAAQAFDGDLFKEIGHTLESIGQEVISGSAAALKTAGIDCIQVEPAKADSWKRAGFCATAADLARHIKLPQPGV